jgi:hypothetical protein
MPKGPPPSTSLTVFAINYVMIYNLLMILK